MVWRTIFNEGRFGNHPSLLSDLLSVRVFGLGGLQAPAEQAFLRGLNGPVADSLDFGPFIGGGVPFQVAIHDLFADGKLGGVSWDKGRFGRRVQWKSHNIAMSKGRAEHWARDDSVIEFGDVLAARTGIEPVFMP